MRPTPARIAASVRFENQESPREVDDDVGPGHWADQGLGPPEVRPCDLDVPGCSEIVRQPGPMHHQPETVPGGEKVAGEPAPQVARRARDQESLGGFTDRRILLFAEDRRLLQPELGHGFDLQEPLPQLREAVEGGDGGQPLSGLRRQRAEALLQQMEEDLTYGLATLLASSLHALPDALLHALLAPPSRPPRSIVDDLVERVSPERGAEALATAAG